MLIDTHSHIYTRHFADDREEAIGRALKNGVEKIFMPNIDSSSVKEMLDTALCFPRICCPMIGLHPTSVREDYKRELDLISAWIGKHDFIGIGETGIDLYWDSTFLVQQEDSFRQHLRLARSMKLPVVIHVRNSFREVISILEQEQEGSLTGIFHCFSGTREEADQITAAGFYLGIGGVVTFQNSRLPEILETVDLKNIVLETDSPYLSPVPHRGKRNESSYLVYIAQKLAGIYGLKTDEIAAVTTANSLRIFDISEETD